MSEDAYMSLASDHVALVEEHRELVAERDRLQRIITDVFVALYPPAPGDGTVRTIEHTEMPAHVRQVIVERDRLRAILYKVQNVLDETVSTDERTQSHVLVQELLNAETRRTELIEAGRAAELDSKTVVGEYRRRAEVAEAERDRLRAVVRKLVDEAGITLDGDFLRYAYDEYVGRCPFTPEEVTAYERALNRSEVMGGSDVDHGQHEFAHPDINHVGEIPTCSAEEPDRG